MRTYRNHSRNVSTIGITRETLQIFRILAAGKNVSLTELMDYLAEPYAYLLEPFKNIDNGHAPRKPKTNTTV